MLSPYIFAGLPADKQNIFMDEIIGGQAGIIIREVSLATDVRIHEMKSSSRKREHVQARHMAIYLIHQNVRGVTLMEIGSMFGGRDHSTVIYAVKSCEDLIKFNKDYRKIFKTIKLKI